jgi:hypothetical protein
MEHMNVEWCVSQDDEGRWDIRTADDYRYYIATLCRRLPGDASGELTARAICDAHNEARKGEYDPITAIPDESQLCE